MTLKEYVKKVLEECPEGEITFDVGLSAPRGWIEVDDSSSNRVMFTIYKKNENRYIEVPRTRGTKIPKLSETSIC